MRPARRAGRPRRRTASAAWGLLQAAAIAAFAGGALFLVCEAVQTVVAALPGWPRGTRMSLGAAPDVLLSRGFW